MLKHSVCNCEQSDNDNFSLSRVSVSRETLQHVDYHELVVAVKKHLRHLVTEPKQSLASCGLASLNGRGYVSSFQSSQGTPFEIITGDKDEVTHIVLPHTRGKNT
jgi:hypothetical protein